MYDREMRKKPRPWLETRLNELADNGKNKSGLAKILGKSASAITYLINGTRDISLDEIQKVADYLEWDRDYLLEMYGGPEFGAVNLETIMVVGAVQAGVYQEAIEWTVDDWYASPINKLRNYKHVKQFGLEVRGTSMNEVYPEGTVLICAKMFDLERNPKPGEKVVAYQVQRDGRVEATVKELRQHEDGSYWLWPRSTDPRFQSPISLPPEDPFTESDGLSLGAIVLYALVPQTD
jgi:repressor LexA